MFKFGDHCKRGCVTMKYLPWESLPKAMQKDQVRPYYDKLAAKRASLFFKRVLDIIGALLLIILLSLPMVIVALWIKADSNGPVFFRQVRVTQYGREFRIIKFRTMVANAETLGAQITGKNDDRITRVGKKIRKIRLDELPQLFNILTGDMTFVGTRPEVPRYVAHYTDEMMATLLLPSGVTSLAAVTFKDEDEMMEGASDPDRVYVEEVLPIKMKYNLSSIEDFGFWKDVGMLFKTVRAVL
jgi:lipopolysaccharide/colanic/teichoic acid biosynthesis glycosyltransferase